MKQIGFLCFLFCACFVLQAQIVSEGPKRSGFSTTSSGLQYKIVKDSVGAPYPETGGAITFWFEMRTQTDSIFDSQFADPNPVGMSTPEIKHKQSIEEGLLLLTEGDSAVFLLNADSLYINTFKREIPDYIERQSTIILIVKMSKVYSKQYVDSVLTNRRNEEEKRFAAELKTYVKDSILIQKYLSDHKLNGEAATLGVYIVKLKSAKKEKPYIVRGETVETTYIAKLLIEGTECDRSGFGRNFEFTVGIGQVIKGWDYAFQRLKLGEKALILVPSGLAYGEIGSGPIPPNAPLVFKVKIKK